MSRSLNNSGIVSQFTDDVTLLTRIEIQTAVPLKALLGATRSPQVEAQDIVSPGVDNTKTDCLRTISDR